MHAGPLIPMVQHERAKDGLSRVDVEDLLDGSRGLDDGADFGAPKRAPGRHFVVGHAVHCDALTRSYPLCDIHDRFPLTQPLAYTLSSPTASAAAGRSARAGPRQATRSPAGRTAAVMGSNPAPGRAITVPTISAVTIREGARELCIDHSSTAVVGRPEGDTCVTSSTFHATPHPWEIPENYINIAEAPPAALLAHAYRRRHGRAGAPPAGQQMRPPVRCARLRRTRPWRPWPRAWCAHERKARQGDGTRGPGQRLTEQRGPVGRAQDAEMPVPIPTDVGPDPCDVTDQLARPSIPAYRCSPPMDSTSSAG